MQRKNAVTPIKSRVMALFCDNISLVEMAVIETASENPSAKLSTSVADYL